MFRFISVLIIAASVTLHCSLSHADFPVPPNKKGLQVQMVDDALAVGIYHAALNVSLGSLFHVKEEAGSSKFTHEGRDFWINESYLKQLDSQIKPLSDAEVVVYLILLAIPTKDAGKDQLLVHPKARADGKYNIAAFNIATPDGLRLYRAMISLLALRYSGKEALHGQVWGYIVGNEVNSPWMWYNLGKSPLSEFVSEYEKAVRATQEEVSKHQPDARVYLSFDHHWNVSMPGISDKESYPGKAFLNLFAKVVRERGDFAWHVAHHPYPDDLGNPRTWLDKDAWPTEDSPHITFKNLEVACRYMEKSELLWLGKPRRIILSEQGIHCLDAPDGEKLQAAGFAYAWEKISRLPGIDALIWHRHVDHAQEGGLKVGLWSTKPGTISDPGAKRLLYDYFQKAGTPAWDEAARGLLPVVGLQKWDELAK